MSIKEYLTKMKNIHECIIEFLDSDDSGNEKFQKLNAIFKDTKIQENPNEIKSILHLLLNISTNHYRSSHFYDKVSEIFNILKDKIKQSFSNYTIFNIFQSNKRILLLLSELEILDIDVSILDALETEKYVNMKYIHYFFPELKKFFNEFSVEGLTKEMPEVYIEDFEKFKEIRKIGENDSYICNLIRNDSIEEFVTHVNKTNLNLNSRIPVSIFETNSFLVDKQPTLIEYASFFGSIQIFQYLVNNKINLTSSLWLYVIHSNNAELIHFLEDNHVDIPKNSYLSCINESIKCHHNSIVDYFKNNFLNEKDSQLINENDDNGNGGDIVSNEKYILLSCIENYNFLEMQNELIDKSIFYELCMHDYFIIVDFLLKNEVIDINSKVVRNVLK